MWLVSHTTSEPETETEYEYEDVGVGFVVRSGTGRRGRRRTAPPKAHCGSILFASHRTAYGVLPPSDVPPFGHKTKVLSLKISFLFFPLHLLFAVWLRSSVVPVLISLIPDCSAQQNI